MPGILFGIEDPSIARGINAEIAADKSQAAVGAERESDQKHMIWELKAAVEKHLEDELLAEIEAKRPTPEIIQRHGRHFKLFRSYAESFDPPLPALPAAPALVASFLAASSDRKAGFAKRALAAISYTHKLASLDDPTGDVLVLAILRGLKSKPIRKDH